MAVAKVDAKGRITLPRQMHEILGDFVELKHVGKEKVLLSKAMKRHANEAMARGRGTNLGLAELFDKEPRRTGKPENPSPDEMKSIWKE